MSLMDGRRLVRALAIGALVFLVAGAGIGAVAADGGSGSEAWTVARPGPGDRATYRMDDRVIDARAADSRYDVGPGMRLDVEWLPAQDIQAVDGGLRTAHPLGTTLRYEGMDWATHVQVAYDAGSGQPLSRAVQWSSTSGGGSSTVSVLGIGDDPGRQYEGRRDNYEGPLAPCGLRADLQGRPVVKGDPVTVYGGCEDDRRQATVYKVHGWERVDGRRLLRLDSGSGLRLHFDPAIPVPVHVEAHMHETWGALPDLLAGRVMTLTLDAYHEGNGEYAAAPMVAPPESPAPVPLATRTPWMLEDAGIAHPFPLSAAYAAAMDPASYSPDEDSETVPEFVARHPRAYLAFAWGEHLEDQRGTDYEGWAMIWTDGEDAIAKSVIRFPFAFVADIPGSPLPGSVIVGPWSNGEQLVEQADEIFPTPAAVPGAFPRVDGAYARAATVLAPFGVEPNSYAIRMVCGATCQEARVEVLAGYTRTPTDPTGVQLQDDQGLTFLLSLDRTGALDAMFRVDSQVESPLPVLPATEAPPKPAAGPGVALASGGAWSLPAAEAVAGVGLVATLLGALYYFWPAVKGGAVGLFSRIQHDRVLEHPARRNVMALVEANPGVHFQDLARRSGFGHGQLDHHLRKLEAASLVSRVQGGAYTCFFAKGAVDRRVMAAAPLTRSDGGRSILDALQQTPGASSRQIATRLGLSAGTVSYHVKRLREAGLLESAGGALHLTDTGRQAASMAA